MAPDDDDDAICEKKIFLRIAVLDMFFPPPVDSVGLRLPASPPAAPFADKEPLEEDAEGVGDS